MQPTAVTEEPTPRNSVRGMAFFKKMKALGLRRGAEKDAGTSGGEG